MVRSSTNDSITIRLPPTVTTLVAAASSPSVPVRHGDVHSSPPAAVALSAPKGAARPSNMAGDVIAAEPSSSAKLIINAGCPPGSTRITPAPRCYCQLPAGITSSDIHSTRCIGLCTSGKRPHADEERVKPGSSCRLKEGRGCFGVVLGCSAASSSGVCRA